MEKTEAERLERVLPEELQPLWQKYPSDLVKVLLAMLQIDDGLQSLGLPQPEYQVKIKAAFLWFMGFWADEDPDHLYTCTEADNVWLSFIGASFNLGKIIQPVLLKWTLEHDQAGALSKVNKMRKEAGIPLSQRDHLPYNLPDSLPDREVRADSKVLSLLFDPPEVLLTPGHSVWLALGVNNSKEWEQLGPTEKILSLARGLERASKALLRAELRAVESKDAIDAKGDDCQIDVGKLQKNYFESKQRKPSLGKKQRSIDAKIEDSGTLHKGYVYRDDQGNIVDIDVKDISGQIDGDQVDGDQAEARVRLIEQLKPRELDLYYAELERLNAKKTRDQWYGLDKAKKVTQQMKYLKEKYSSR